MSRLGIARGFSSVTAVAETIQGLINSLEVATSNAIEWIRNNDVMY